MKKLILGCLSACMLMLAGCSSANYERSTDAGKLIEITFEEAMTKMENDETYVFALTQTSCSHCIKFKEEVLLDYIEEHELLFYDVLLDHEESIDPIYEFVKEHPNPSKYLTSDMDPESVYTPTFYFVKDGKVEDIYIGEMSSEDLEDYVVKYQLDKAE